jgi:uncharacterized protein (TIGR00299 family) protein
VRGVIAHLNCPSGISGDKFLGALIDAGFDSELLRAALEPLGIRRTDLQIERVASGGIAAVSVKLARPTGAARPARPLTELRTMIGSAALPEPVVAGALRALDSLAEAEANVHGIAAGDVHVHEVGDDDTVLDLLGVSMGLAELTVDHLVCTAVAVGSGTVATAHGPLPVPAPATAQLLLGIPVAPGPSLPYGAPAGELTTPTGAALVRAFADDFGPMPDMTPKSIGYGAGQRDLGFPNVARIVIGEPEAMRGTGTETQGLSAMEVVSVLETNIDHLTSEQLAFAAAELLGDGALDVWQTPIVMKKGRAAVSLAVMCEPVQAPAFISRIHELTGTLGVRRSDVGRSVLSRELRRMQTRYGPVRVKVSHVAGVRSPRPEHEDVARIAREVGGSLLEISAHIAEDVAAGIFLE